MGLISIPYLLIIAISSLSFNHVLFPEKSSRTPKEYSHTYSIPYDQDKEKIIGALMDSLQIYGWNLPWESSFDSLEAKVNFVHPGKHYATTLSFSTGKVRVIETFKPFGYTIRGLHGLGSAIPKGPWWVNTWPYYQNIALYGMIFWFMTGLYLWYSRKNTRLEKIILMVFSFATLILILLIWHNN